MPNRVSMSTTHTHTVAVHRCAKILRAMGIRLFKADHYRDGYDLVAEKKVRIAVRHATARLRKGKVYRRVDGTVSKHPYLRWTFNFHRHGKLDRAERYCDFFVCLLHGTARSRTAVEQLPAFVIPWEVVNALTFSSSLRDGSARTYRGRYAPYRDAWHLVETAAASDAPSSRRRESATIVSPTTPIRPVLMDVVST